MQHTWALQDAKNRFSELVEQALHDGPQMVTRRGKETVVVMGSMPRKIMSGPSFLLQPHSTTVECGATRSINEGKKGHLSFLATQGPFHYDQKVLTGIARKTNVSS